MLLGLTTPPHHRQQELVSHLQLRRFAAADCAFARAERQAQSVRFNEAGLAILDQFVDQEDPQSGHALKHFFVVG
jgi:hypothetical protein